MCLGCFFIPLVGGVLGEAAMAHWNKTEEALNTDTKSASFFGRIISIPLVRDILENSIIMNTQQSICVRVISTITGVGLTVGSYQAVKLVFAISFCGSSGFSIIRAVLILVPSVFVSLIYALGVNVVLNRIFPVPGKRDSDMENVVKACCSNCH